METTTSIATDRMVPFRTREHLGALPTLAPISVPVQGTTVSVAGVTDAARGTGFRALSLVPTMLSRLLVPDAGPGASAPSGAGFAGAAVDALRTFDAILIGGGSAGTACGMVKPRPSACCAPAARFPLPRAASLQSARRPKSSRRRERGWRTSSGRASRPRPRR